jgi:hypothetical protein
MSNADPSGDIYLTAKARMVAESRLKNADMMSQILIAWYSVCLIGISLLDLSQTYKVRDVSVMTAILSVAVLATSIFIPGRNFSVRAAGYRDCYLQLQKIYRSTLTPAEKAEAYASILPLFENHSQADYESVLFKSRIFGEHLANASGPVSVSNGVALKCVLRAALKYLFIAILFLFPVAFAYALVLPRGS